MVQCLVRTRIVVEADELGDEAPQVLLASRANMGAAFRSGAGNAVAPSATSGAFAILSRVAA